MMVFSSLTFIFMFLLATIALYYVIPFRFKNAILLIMSLVFYAWGEPVYIILMVYEIVFNYCFGLLMDKSEKHKKYILAFSIIVDIGILFFFKYYSFLIKNINNAFNVNLKIHNLALPIGISFYTFQTLSYMIDLYRGKFKAQKNFIKFAVYISMFPQLIAGPIVRYEDIYSSLDEREHSLELFGKGVFRFIIGLAKKVLLANTVARIFDYVNALNGNITTLSAWIGAIAYTFQIYFDFSGYSDMAIGLGKMFGFSFSENFNYPYIAKNITDFWRRWHISLSGWFREYVYIPLGGNRVSAVKHVRNLFIVWLLTGLWHGAEWTFVIWGLYYFVLLTFEKYVIKDKKIPTIISQPITIILIIIGWVVFSAKSINDAWFMLTTMFGRDTILFNSTTFYILQNGGFVLMMCLIFCLPYPKIIGQKLSGSVIGRIVLYFSLVTLVALCIIYLVTQNYNPFLYFQF